MHVNHEDWDVRFIGEEVDVEFDEAPLFSKKPHCPNRLVWGNETLSIESLLTEWRNYDRRGRSSVNMRPSNLAKASRKGSWGVGRYYFRIKLENGRIFDLYYDRAPKGLKKRGGRWFLDREIIPKG